MLACLITAIPKKCVQSIECKRWPVRRRTGQRTNNADKVTGARRKPWRSSIPYVGRPEMAQEIGFAERHARIAEDRISCRDVEKEIGQHKSR